MRLNARIVLAVSSCLGTAQTFAASWASFADVAARVDYGFYAEEPAVIEAAFDALERTGPEGEVADYYRALAAWRIALLQPRDAGAASRKWLAQCARLVPPPDARTHAAAEAWVVLAACALATARAEPVRGLLQQRRAAQALERAAAIDPGNPRLVLVRAQSSRAGGGALPAGAAAAFASAVEAFELRAATDGPQWGEAEALASLAAARLAEGQLQAARDLVERALLLAPDYRFALALREQIAANH